MQVLSSISPGKGSTAWGKCVFRTDAHRTSKHGCSHLGKFLCDSLLDINAMESMIRQIVSKFADIVEMHHVLSNYIHKIFTSICNILNWHRVWMVDGTVHVPEFAEYTAKILLQLLEVVMERAGVWPEIMQPGTHRVGKAGKQLLLKRKWKMCAQLQHRYCCINLNQIE